MGVMRFIVHPPSMRDRWPSVEKAYLSGMDGRIYPTRVEFSDGVLCCRRPLSDSGKLSLPYRLANDDVIVLSTTSLREREAPYLLILELARGKLSELRDQAAAWEMGRMTIPSVFRERQREAFRLFARASASQENLDLACGLAMESIELSVRCASLLVDAYIIQRITNIRRTSHLPMGLLGAVLDRTVLSGSGPATFESAFTAAAIPMNWKQIEPTEGSYEWEGVEEMLDFCQQQRVSVKGGPLIDLGDGGLPDWLAPWKDDFLNLPSFVCDYIETAISRFTGLIRFWEVSDFGNTGSALNLGEEHRLALVARTLEAAHKTDGDAQFFIGIDQPWGEYQRQGGHRLSPIQFVDALIRSSLGLAGVTLHLNTGYQGQASYPRDMLSISRLIDLWSMLGIQIHVNLACPSMCAVDPLSGSLVTVDGSVRRETWDEDLQCEWIEQVLPLLLAKPAVTGVFLEQFSDGVPHRFPHAGLLRPDGQPKRMLAPLRRQKYQDLT